MLKSRKILLASTAVATALALSGCTGGSMPGMDMGGSGAPASSESATAAADYNSADVMFAQMMIPHHEQAVAMSDTLLSKEGIDPRVLDLATQIKEAQQPEIDQLREWLGEWGQKESGMSGMSGGTMSDDDMAALENATGPEAARLFLQQMTVHHQSAIDAAQAEVEDGQNADAKAMAESIVATQTEELATMQELLASL